MQRAGKQIFQRNVEVVKELSDKYMFSYNEFMKQIMVAIDSQNYSCFESYLHKLLFSISEKYEITPEEFDSISSILDNCYIMIASKQFVMDLKALESLNTETAWNFDFEDLDKIGDFTVDITCNGEYLPVMLKVCKASYTISSNKHSDMEIYNVSLMRYNERTRIIECLGTFAFSKELPNRIIVESDSQINCRRCASCKFFNEYTVKIKLGLEAPISFCLVSRKRIENAKCLYHRLPINPIEIMSAKHANFLKSDSALGITDNIGKDCISTKYDGLAINRVSCHLEKFGDTYYYVYGSRVYSFTIVNENIETVKDTGIVLYGAWDYTMIRCIAGEDGSLESILYNGKNDVYVYSVTQNKFYCCNVPEKRHIFSVAYSANPDADDFEGVDVDDSVSINPYIVQYSYRFYNQDDNSSCLEENDKVDWPDVSRELETDENGNVIIKVPVTALAISSTKKTIALNEVLYLNAAYYPTNATIANITWTSSDENIATVTKLGVVHPKNVGQTTITYKVNDDLELSCVVDVVSVGTIVSPDTDSDFSVTGPASAEVSDLVTDDEEIKKASTGVQTAENSDKEEDDVLRNQWVVQDAEEYYYTADGSLAKGFVMIEDELHYFNKKNQLVYGWFKIGKKKYYSNSVGVVSTGLVKIGKKKYYFSDKGVMKTGLQKIGKKKKKTYYFSKKGVMQTGWVKVKGKWKFFNKKGVYVKGKKK